MLKISFKKLSYDDISIKLTLGRAAEPHRLPLYKNSLAIKVLAICKAFEDEGITESMCSGWEARIPHLRFGLSTVSVVLGYKIVSLKFGIFLMDLNGRGSI